MTGWLGGKSSADAHGPQRKNPNDFGGSRPNVRASQDSKM